MRRVLAAAILAVTAFLLLVVQTGGAERWTAAGTSPNARSEVAAARVGDAAFVVGGYLAPGGTTTGLTERYDLRRGRWRTVAPLPQPVNHPAAAAYRGSVYVIGGDTGGSGPTNAFWRYEVKRNRWSRMPAAPTKRAALGAAVIGRRLYAVGGVNGSGALTTLEVFDFRTRRWSRGPSMRFAREHLGVTAARGKLWVLAGRTGGTNFTYAERFDPRTRKWERLPDLKRQRGGNTATATPSGTVVVLGGEEAAGTIAEVERWNGKRWVGLAPMRTPRHGLGAVGFGNRVFALSGGPEPGLHFSGLAEALRVE